MTTKTIDANVKLSHTVKRNESVDLDFGHGTGLSYEVASNGNDLNITAKYYKYYVTADITGTIDGKEFSREGVRFDIVGYKPYEDFNNELDGKLYWGSKDLNYNDGKWGMYVALDNTDFAEGVSGQLWDETTAAGTTKLNYSNFKLNYIDENGVEHTMTSDEAVKFYTSKTIEDVTGDYGVGSMTLKDYVRNAAGQVTIGEQKLESILAANFQYDLGEGVKGTRLNDVTTGKAGNDKFDLGKGNDVINIDVNGYGKDTVTLTKGENLTLNIKDGETVIDPTKLTVEKVGSDIKISSKVEYIMEATLQGEMNGYKVDGKTAIAEFDGTKTYQFKIATCHTEDETNPLNGKLGWTTVDPIITAAENKEASGVDSPTYYTWFLELNGTKDALADGYQAWKLEPTDEEWKRIDVKDCQVFRVVNGVKTPIDTEVIAALNDDTEGVEIEGTKYPIAQDYMNELLGKQTADSITLKDYAKTQAASVTINGKSLYDIVASQGGLAITSSKAGKIDGTNFADVIKGTAGKDTIYTYGGEDTIDSGAKNDTIYIGGKRAAEGETATNIKTISLDKGEGSDTIVNYKNADKITLNFGTEYDSKAYNRVGNDLVISATDYEGVELTAINKLYVTKDGKLTTTKGKNSLVGADLYKAADGKYSTKLADGYSVAEENEYYYDADNKIQLVSKAANDSITESTKYVDAGTILKYTPAVAEVVADEEAGIAGSAAVPESWAVSTDYTKLATNNWYKHADGTINNVSTDALTEKTTIKGYYSDVVDNVYVGSKTLSSILNANPVSYGNASANYKKAQKLTGSDYSEVFTGGKAADTIKTGAGNDKVVANAGNDKIYINGTGVKTVDAGAGNDTVYVKADVNAGSRITFSAGKDVLDVAKGVNVGNLKLADVDITKATFTKSGNNLVITNAKNNTVTIKNYFVAGYTGGEGVTTDLGKIKIGDTTLDAIVAKLGISGNSKTLNGTKYGDVITAGAKVKTVDAGAGDDLVVTSYHKGLTVAGGDGEDTLRFTTINKDYTAALNVQGEEVAAVAAALGEDGETVVTPAVDAYTKYDINFNSGDLKVGDFNSKGKATYNVTTTGVEHIEVAGQYKSTVYLVGDDIYTSKPKKGAYTKFTYNADAKTYISADKKSYLTLGEDGYKGAGITKTVETTPVEGTVYSYTTGTGDEATTTYSTSAPEGYTLQEGTFYAKGSDIITESAYSELPVSGEVGVTVQSDYTKVTAPVYKNGDAYTTALPEGYAVAEGTFNKKVDGTIVTATSEVIAAKYGETGMNEFTGVGQRYYYGKTDDGEQVFGNQYEELTARTANVKGTEANDVYNVTNFDFSQDSLVITDNGGTDELNITGVADQWYSVLYNIKADKEYTATEGMVTVDKAVAIGNGETQASLYENERAGILLKGDIEKINITDKATDTVTYGASAELSAEVVASVQSWLEGHNYADVQAVFEGDKYQDMAALIEAYTGYTAPNMPTEA